MMNRGQIEWQDREKELYELYRFETAVELKPRFQALWLLSSGRSRMEVAEIVGINHRTLRDWIAWYRHGGVAEVRKHRKGNYTGRIAWLSKDQESSSPELNPAERVGQAIRAEIEGRVYGSIWQKMAATESLLQKLAADKKRVKSLVGWDWILRSLRQLPKKGS